jgi:hypothetical protein
MTSETTERSGDWYFHCHKPMHMEGGMIVLAKIGRGSTSAARRSPSEVARLDSHPPVTPVALCLVCHHASADRSCHTPGEPRLGGMATSRDRRNDGQSHAAKRVSQTCHDRTWPGRRWRLGRVVGIGPGRPTAAQNPERRPAGNRASGAPSLLCHEGWLESAEGIPLCGGDRQHLAIHPLLLRLREYRPPPQCRLLCSGAAPRWAPHLHQPWCRVRHLPQHHA